MNIDNNIMNVNNTELTNNHEHNWDLSLPSLNVHELKRKQNLSTIVPNDSSDLNLSYLSNDKQQHDGNVCF